MIGEMIRLLKLLGPGKAVRSKRHHEEGLKYIRGYAATQCWWALLQSGFVDELTANHDHVYLPKYVANQEQINTDVLEAILEYLEGIGIVERRNENKAVFLTGQGRALREEPRGMFELLYAYEPCFTALGELLRGQKKYGVEVQRRVTWVGIGSARLCEQLPYPIMRQMVREAGSRQVLDLGCGDLGLLRGLCEEDEGIRGHGVDFAAEMVAYDKEMLAKENYGGRLTVQEGDMFALGELAGEAGEVDCITAVDTFHEYLPDEEKIVGLLRGLRERFAGARMVVGEFCKQDAAWLKRHPTASLEHHLFHALSGQTIGTAEQWRSIFGRAGWEVEKEDIYMMIGHGYFRLRPGSV